MAKAKLILVLILVTGCATAPSASSSPLRLSVFASDVTPPIGHPLCGGWIKPVDAIEQPLALKGVILDDGSTRCVLAAIDWCVLGGAAREQFRSKMAKAAGVPENRIALHCTHTHSAPIADTRAEQLIAATAQPVKHLDLDWFGQITDRAAGAVKDAVPRLRPFTHVGVGQARVENFASTRRVVGPDGKIKVRYSSTKDPFLKEAPEGRIDPWLKTITFFDGEDPLLRLHYYASHPQSHYGDGKAHPDTPGMARSYLEGEEGIPQIYFTGCGGDVTAGKYNDGSMKARIDMSKQLYSGMIRAVAATRRVPVGSFAWKTVDVRLPLRTEAEYSEESLRKTLNDPAVPGSRRLNAALDLAWRERMKARPEIDLARLRIGPADIVHLPGEPFVEFQLYAQGLKPDRFIAVAGYGEGGTGYVCTDKAFAEGGYEPTQSMVGPPTESVLKAAIEELLK